MSGWEYILRWEVLWWLLMLLYVPSCIGLIVIVLLQKGKGTGFAGAFGVGPGSDAVFGPRMSKSLPVRLTYIMAGTFMTLAIVLSLISGRVGKGIAPDEVAPQEQPVELLPGVGTAPTEPAPVPSFEITPTAEETEMPGGVGDAEPAQVGPGDVSPEVEVIEGDTVEAGTS